MKKVILLLVTIPMLLISCSKDPYSNFTVSDDVVGIGETVHFTNRSTDAESFEWDFGDGFISQSFNASHYYDLDNNYTISLKAFHKGEVDISYMSVTVEGASVEITVEEYYEPYARVADISVILYPTIKDWEDGTNMVAEGYTNAEGNIRFDHLAKQRYYVDVWGPNHDNYTLAEEDAGFIETPVLHLGTVTYWTALVDYYPDVKKSTISRSELKAQRKLEAAVQKPRVHSERKK